MKSILVIGLGRFGRHMTEKLLEEGNSVLAIEKNSERADAAAVDIPNIQIGDASDEAFLRSLGVANFDLCVVAICEDFLHALEITALLKDLGAKYIIARAATDVHKELLIRIGADHVVYSEREAAERLAIRFGSNNLFDYIELTDEVAIYEIAVPNSWKGKSIVEKSIRNKYNISILATKKDGSIYPLPSPDHVFSEGESLIIIAEKSMLKNLIKM